MQDITIKKLYYSISDVSQITDVKQHVLRYWESEFPELRPAKNRAGNRIYRLKEIKLLFLIKQLLYDEKYTVDGAKKKLKEMLRANEDAEDIPVDKRSVQVRVILQDIRSDLEELNHLI